MARAERDFPDVDPNRPPHSEVTITHTDELIVTNCHAIVVGRMVEPRPAAP